MRETLRSLPKTLDETYDRILVGIGEHDRSYAFRALQWLAFSARPVSIEEVAEAMVVDMDCDLPHVDYERALRDPRDLLDICTSLVRISRQENDIWGRSTQSLQLSHFSVKEYLVSPRIRDGLAAGFGLEEALAHESPAQCCLAYILSFERLMSNSDLSAYPLARYSAQYWLFHTRAAKRDCNTLNCFATKVFSPERLCFENSLRLYDEEGRKIIDSRRGKPLYYVALNGCLGLASSLIDGGADVNAEGGVYGNALCAASARGHPEVVQLLLDKGADITAKHRFYGSALQVASHNGYCEVVRLLIQNGADAQDQGTTALHAALARGNVNVMRLLLDYGADKNARGGGFNDSALEIVSSYGNLEAVRLLLEHRASVGAHGGRYGSALQAASAEGHFEVVRLLLENGADANAQGGEHGGALQAASAKSDLEVVQLLLENGADANAQGGRYGSTLQAASARNNPELVRRLLENGADANAQGGEYGSALQAALTLGSLEVVRLLLQIGPDANAQSGELGSVLQAASE